MKSSTPWIVCLAVSAITLTSCKDSPAPEDTSEVAQSAAVLQDAQVNTHESVLPENQPDVVAVEGTSGIPYPIYPNGSQYRVGGENGLKIVLFETADTFDEVDNFYRAMAAKEQMPRLAAMSDYVRYGTDADDNDPWATYRPGIVIHQFNDDTERDAVGANRTAKANIIMSF